MKTKLFVNFAFKANLICIMSSKLANKLSLSWSFPVILVLHNCQSFQSPYIKLPAPTYCKFLSFLCIRSPPFTEPIVPTLLLLLAICVLSVYYCNILLFSLSTNRTFLQTGERVHF
jgi:hypothetical protein